LDKNYLQNRKQKLIIRNLQAHIGFIKAGFLQGSVLGLLLFIIYINKKYRYQEMKQKEQSKLKIQKTRLSHKIRRHK